MEDIFGMLNCFGGNSNVSDILSDIVLGMYALWHIQCYIDGLMYHTHYRCGAHDALSFGQL